MSAVRKAAFSAGRWTTAALAFRTVLQVSQTMLLVRLVAPSDFGIMATAMAAYAIVGMFADLGISNALVHFRNPSSRALATVYWLNVGSALVLMLVFMALAWPFAFIYGEPELLPVMGGMSLALPLSALGQQFYVLAEKELRFAALAGIELLAGVCGFAAAVGVAWQHGGVYSFVSGMLVSAAVSSGMAWLYLSSGVRPAFHFDWEEARPYVRYGSYRLGDNLCNSLQSQADILLGGAVLGSAAIGVYTVPRNLALQVANSLINPVVTRVGLPVMAQLQHDKAALKSAYLQTMRMTASVNFPIYIGLAVWSDEAVAVLLGNQWDGAGAFLRILALWALVRSTGNPVGSLLYATGHVRRAFWWSLALLALVPGPLWLAVRIGGLHGLAVAMLCVHLLIFYPLFRFMVRPACGARFGEYTAVLLPPLLAAVLAAGGGFILGSLMGDGMWTRISVGGAVAALAYLALSRIVNKPWLDAMGELMTPLFRFSR